MLGENHLGSQFTDMAFAERAKVFLRSDAGNAIAHGRVVMQGREVGGGVLGIPHAGEATDDQDFRKGRAAVDEVGDALRGVELRKVHDILFHSLHEFHLDDIEVIVLEHGHFHLHIPVGGIGAVEQAFPEAALAFAAHIGDAAEQAIHVTVGTHPGIALLEHIEPGLTQLPRGSDEFGVGIFAILDEDEWEAHKVPYSA